MGILQSTGCSNNIAPYLNDERQPRDSTRKAAGYTAEDVVCLSTRGHFPGWRVECDGLPGSTVQNLNPKAWLALMVLAVAIAFLLFVPAGTIHYWQAWMYLSIFTGASALITIYLMRRDPALLERRMSGGSMAEKERAQKLIMLCTSVCFVALLAVPAFDHRFGWSTMPLGGVVSGDVLVVIGFYLIFLVYRENTFTSATIEVVENQKVISTGPYAIVRHPMYASASLYLLGTPLALGSYWAFIAVGAMTPFLIWRLLDEERFLAKNLPGYGEYQNRVRHRLVPFVW